MRTLMLFCAFVVASVGVVHAQLNLRNGSDIDMTGSAGSQIVFPDGTILTTAADIESAPGHGGLGNTVSGSLAFVGGGQNNTASGNLSSVSGGANNTTGGARSAVGGGQLNGALGMDSTVGGGYDNDIADTGTSSTIAGGQSNLISGVFANIAGGYNNSVVGNFSTVAGGRDNSASGDYGTAIGGRLNSAESPYSFAAGFRAKANYFASFVWADGQNFDTYSSGANSFKVRSTGGARFITAIDGNGADTAGVVLDAGSNAWSSLSRRDSKENFTDIDSVQILEKLAGLNIQQWNYKANDDTVHHIGPIAEDFHEAFKLDGEYDGRISTLDADGVALAAIQGLNKKLEERDAVIAELQARLDAMEAKIEGR